MKFLNTLSQISGAIAVILFTIAVIDTATMNFPLWYKITIYTAMFLWFGLAGIRDMIVKYKTEIKPKIDALNEVMDGTAQVNEYFKDIHPYKEPKL